jgi:hypothetical protein
MNNERAGDRVFADVDEALAGRVISRSKENSGENAPMRNDNPANPKINGTNHTHGLDDFPLLPEGALPLVKIAALLLALIVIMLLLFRRKADDDD